MACSSSTIEIIRKQALRFPLVESKEATFSLTRRRCSLGWVSPRSVTSLAHRPQMGWPQAWEHAVSEDGEDAILVFDCRFDPAPELWPVQSVFRSVG